MTRKNGSLPYLAQEALKTASQTGLPGSFTRQKAIDRAIKTVREAHPEYFIKDKRP